MANKEYKYQGIKKTVQRMYRDIADLDAFDEEVSVLTLDGMSFRDVVRLKKALVVLSRLGATCNKIRRDAINMSEEIQVLLKKIK